MEDWVEIPSPEITYAILPEDVPVGVAVRARSGPFAGIGDVVYACNSEIQQKKDKWLLQAIKNGYVPAVKMLLAADASANAVDEYGDSALILAVKGHIVNPEIVGALLEKKADVNFRDSSGSTALMIITKNLLARNWHSIMSIAEECDKSGLVSDILDAGADINTLDTLGGYTALMWSVCFGHKASVDVLVADGVDVNATDSDGATALAYAVDLGHSDIVIALLEVGADFEIASEYGWTPLMLAARSGKLEVVNALLGKGAEVEVANRRGWTALMYAVNQDRVEIINALLDHGADIDAIDNEGNTSLILVVGSNPKAKAIQLLLDRGADVNIVSAKHGYTALMRAAWGSMQGGKSGWVAVVEALLEAGADIDAADNKGNTALGWASFAVAKVLLAHNPRDRTCQWKLD